jgi:hypothetical protein
MMTSDIDFSKASAGIVNPRSVTLPAGTLLFRFAGSIDKRTGRETTEDDWYRSPWWISQKDFKRIYNRGLGHNTGRSQNRDQTISRNARNGLAVLNSWSHMDVMVKATTRTSIRAYAGQGRAQATGVEDETQCLVMFPNQGITQLHLLDMENTQWVLSRDGFQPLSLCDE